MFQINKAAWTLALTAMLASCGAQNDDGTTKATPLTPGVTQPAASDPAKATPATTTTPASATEVSATTGGVVLDESKPADSTGATGSVSLGFGSLSSLGLMLVDIVPAEPATIKVGDVTVTYAKFNIAKIKLKSDKDPSTQEQQLEQQENTAEVASSSEVAELSGETAATTTTTDATMALAGGAASGGGSTAGGGSVGGKSHKDAKADMVAKLMAKKDELKAKGQADLDKEAKSDKATKFVGPYVYDAVLGKLEGDAPTVDTTDGSYKRVEFQLKRDFVSADSEPLFGNVFAIKGTVLLNNVAVPFVVDWNIALNFRMAGDGAFAVAPGGDNKLAIGFDVSKWFAGIDWSKAKVDADGSIYVDKKTNHDIVKVLHKNIKLSAGFGKDKDGDGKIAAGEGAGKGEETTDAVAP